MPAKYIKRDFVKGGYYHIYNSAIEGQDLFRDEEDYNTFLYYLTIYLTPLDRLVKKYPELPGRYYHRNLSKELELLAYSLQPNHFHFLIKQEASTTALPQFMKQLANAYMQHMNEKYHRQGVLFQGRYKAARVTDIKTLPLLSRHFHLEPTISMNKNLEDYHWSSYPEYISLSHRSLAHTKTILSYFPSIYAYKKYHHDKKDYEKSLRKLEGILIE